MKQKKFKLGLNTFYSLGAAVVIAGVGCKLLHLPGSFGFIAAGLGAEVIVFMVIAFSKESFEPDWTRVYPELSPDFDGPLASPAKSNFIGDGTAQQLDKLFQDAKIGPDLVQSLGNGLRSFGEKVSAISNVHDAALSTDEFSKKVKSASMQVGTLSEAFAKSTASLVEISNTSGESKAYHEQVTALAKNLSALNAVYEIELRDSNDRAERSRFVFERRQPDQTHHQRQGQAGEPGDTRPTPGLDQCSALRERSPQRRNRHVSCLRRVATQ